MQSTKLKLSKSVGLTSVTAKKIYQRWNTVEEVAQLTIGDLKPYWGISDSRAQNIITLARQTLEDVVGKGISETDLEEVAIKAKIRSQALEDGSLEEPMDLIIDPAQKPSVKFDKDRWDGSEEPLREYVMVEERIDSFTLKRSRREITPSVSRLTGIDICEINGLPKFEDCPPHVQVQVTKALEKHDAINASVANRHIITNKDDTSFGVNPSIEPPKRRVLQATR